MKRTYKYALSAVLGLSLSVPAMAQTGFSDVKDSHWAADSVNRLKLSGLVHGFKDGEFKGDRTMTRYEMASAVYAIYAKLVCFNEEVDKKIKALEAKINSIKPGETPNAPDLSDIKQAIADMRNDVGTIKAWGQDLAQLKKMTASYANDLRSIGADVKDMQKNISDVQSRVAKLEANPGGLKISGDANFWMAGSQTANDSRGVSNQDGASIISNIDGGAGFDNMIMLHEFGINIEDKTAKVPYKAEVVIGNTISDGGGGFGDQVYDASVFRGISSGNDNVWIHELTGTYRPWNMKFGRQGVMLNKFVLQRPDITSFYSNKRWDDHTYRMDGASMKFANDKGMVFAGQVSNATNTFGTILQPIMLATLPVLRMMGGTYDFKFGGDKGKISASYVDFDGFAGQTMFLTRGENEPPPPPNNNLSRVNVYGLDLNYDLGGLQLELGGGKSVGYGVAQLGLTAKGSDTQNLDTLVDSANGRWDASLSSQSENHLFKVTYRNVETNYFAPGDWGRVSMFHNLTDTKAYNATAVVMATKKIGVHGFYERGEAIAGIGNYSMWRAGANTWITPKWTVDFTMEDTNFKGGFQGINDGSSTKFRTARLGYDAGENRSFNVFAQQSLLDGVGTLPRVPGKGVFYGFQYSIKF